MEKSKFINKATTEFLKSKAGSTIQQQLQNIRERIELESKDIDQLVKNHEGERHINKHEFRTVTKRIDQLSTDLNILSKGFNDIIIDITDMNEDLFDTQKRLLYTVVGFSLGLIGVMVWLALK